MSASEAVAARQKAIQSLQADAQPAGSKEVVSLYAGAVYNLYTYKVYTDVRFVFIVEYKVGFFGGDPDNFGYPRYCMDVAMFRLYENDKPASTPNYLKWSPTGTKEGDLVFTTGHPGTTYRLNTLAHFKYRRDSALAFAIASNESREAATKKWMALSAENARQATSELFGIQNSLKNQRGQLKGLQDPAVMSKKEADEKRILAALAKDPAKQKEYADALATIEKSLDTARQLDAERNFIANASGLNSQLFTQARQIVRAAYSPAPAGGGQRGGGQRGGGAPAAGSPPQGGGQRGGAGAAAVNTAREKINLTESLAFMQKFLGPDHEIVKLILGDKTPEARATELIEKTRITDPEINALLRAGGKAAVDVATDPMIVLARTLEPRAQAVDKKYTDEVTTVQSGGLSEGRGGGGGGRCREGLVRRDRHAAPVVRNGQELHGGREEGPSVHLHPGPLRAFGAARQPGPVRTRTELGGRQEHPRPEGAVQPGDDQRHRRRQQRVGDGRQEGRTRGAGLRREPADAGRVLHLLRRLQPRDLGGLAADPRGAAEGLQGRRARGRARRAREEEVGSAKAGAVARREAEEAAGSPFSPSALRTPVYWPAISTHRGLDP